MYLLSAGGNPWHSHSLLPTELLQTTGADNERERTHSLSNYRWTRQNAARFKSSLCSLPDFLLTVDAELDLSAREAHRAAGGADVDARVLCSGPGDVKVAVGPGLKVRVVPG